MVRTGLHCAPGAHRTLGTFPEGTVRFSFGNFSTKDQVDVAVQAILALADYAAETRRTDTMEQKQIGVVTFFSSQHAIRAEETLKEKGYEVSLMAGPKEISPNCGVALQFQPQYRDEVESILKEKDVLFEAVHLYTPKVEKGILKKLLGK